MNVVNTFYGFYTDIPGRNIVTTFGTGVWTTEHVKALTEDVLRVGKNFNGRWAYIADPTGIDATISKEVSAEFIMLHKRLAEAGCNAIAFLDGNTAIMQRLSQMHQDSSASRLFVGHFETEEEALDWLLSIGI